MGKKQYYDSFREKGRTSESRKSGKRKFLECILSRMP